MHAAWDAAHGKSIGEVRPAAAPDLDAFALLQGGDAEAGPGGQSDWQAGRAVTGVGSRRLTTSVALAKYSFKYFAIIFTPSCPDLYFSQRIASSLLAAETPTTTAREKRHRDGGLDRKTARRWAQRPHLSQRADGEARGTADAGIGGDDGERFRADGGSRRMPA